MNFEYNITYRQKDKGWQFIISYKDETGKWRQKSKQGFKNKKDAKPVAEKTMLELKASLKNSKQILSNNYGNITFKELSDAFLDHKKLYIKACTYTSYRQNLKVFKDLNDKKIIDIKKMDIQKIFDVLLEKKSKYNTLKDYRGTLNLLFKFYKENYDPNYENNINIKLPKKDSTLKKALTKSELDNVLHFFKSKPPTGQWQYITCLIAGTCGLRFSEIMGLKWNDIDSINLTLTVERQYRQNLNGEWEFITPKSKNSTRIIPLPKSTYEELKKYRNEHPTDIHNRIVTKNPRTAQYLLNRSLNKIASISLHELRHTYITLLVANNVDFKTVAQFAGHDVEQTLKVYSHVNDDMLKIASNKIAKIF